MFGYACLKHKCTLHTAYFALHTAYHRLNTAHIKLCTAHYTLYTTQSTLHTEYLTLHTVEWLTGWVGTGANIQCQLLSNSKNITKQHCQGTCQGSLLDSFAAGIYIYIYIFYMTCQDGHGRCYTLVTGNL